MADGLLCGLMWTVEQQFLGIQEPEDFILKVFFKVLFLFTCMYVSTCMSHRGRCSPRPEKDFRSPWSWSYRRLGAVWEQNFHPLGRQGGLCLISSPILFLLFFYEFRACLFLFMLILVILCSLFEIFVFLMQTLITICMS